VTLGTVVGHTACTALAVLGGRYVSTKISVKHGSLSETFLRFECSHVPRHVSYSGGGYALPDFWSHLSLRVRRRIYGGVSDTHRLGHHHQYITLFLDAPSTFLYLWVT